MKVARKFIGEVGGRTLAASLALTALSGLLLGGLLLVSHAQGRIYPDAPAPVHQQGDVKMTPELQAQFAAIIQEKESRTPAQQKIDSQLLYALKKRRNDPLFKKLPDYQVPDLADAQGMVDIEVKGRVTTELLNHIVSKRGQFNSAYDSFQSVHALYPIDSLETLAARPEVQFIKRAGQMKTNQYGTYESEGDTAHGAIIARNTFGVTGAGLKIGVMSDSCTTSDVAETGTITVLQNYTGGTNEGSAITEIVKDLVPGASMYFATAYSTEATFAANILALANAGCKIIVDDVGYFDESPFQDGTVAQAVNTVTANGVLYFSSAGNNYGYDVDAGGNNSGTWEGNFVSSGTNLVVSGSTKGVMHSWGPASQNLYNGLSYYSPAYRYYSTYPRLASQGYNLFWSDALGKSSNDYDLYIIGETSSGTTSVLTSSTNVQNGTQNPYEECTFTPTTSRVPMVVVVQKTGAQARYLHVDTSAGTSTFEYYYTAGSTRGHNCAANAFNVAAVDAHTTETTVASGNPFTSQLFQGGAVNQPEYFSSDGPRQMFYNADGTAITPGNFLAGGGTVRMKPDVTAADGVTTSLSSFTPFYGTSAAGPHAASVAALMLSFRPNLTPDQVRSVLTSTALDVEVKDNTTPSIPTTGGGTLLPGTIGWDRDTGYGIVMANAALGELASSTVGLVTSGSPSYATHGVTFTATVTPVITPNTPTPTGTVTFTDGATTLGTVSLTSGSAAFTTSTLSVGSHSIVATYNGDTNYPVAYSTASSTVTQVVNPIATNVTAQVSVTRGAFRYSNSTSTFNQSVTVTNTSGAAITGPISLVLDGLAGSITMANKDGVTVQTSPASSPYKSSGGSLAAGASVTFAVALSNPSQVAMTYTPRVLAGSNAR